MRLGVKHQNQQAVAFEDFSGGLNTSASASGIQKNQLSAAVNVEVDHATGRLKTVAGTTDILQFENIFAAAYDTINKKILLVKEDKKVYVVDSARNVSHSLGELSGGLYPVCTSWEDGLLIASGGKLQYFNGTTLETISDSPDATSVYVRAGRVLVTDKNNVRYSGVGDETNWTEDTNDDSSSKFVEAGYKDGGKLIGMVDLSSDVLLIKDNRRLYRLSGEYPDWQISEVSRNADVSGRMSYCAVADSVFILGRNSVQNIQTTADYGDMKLQNVSELIKDDIQSLPRNSFLRYVPPLSQIWAINRTDVFMFDLFTNSWYKRKFNSPIVDVISIDNDVLIIKQDRISKLDEACFDDVGLPLRWEIQAQRLISQHDFFLKRIQIIMLLNSFLFGEGQFRVGAVVVNLPGVHKLLYPSHTFIFENLEPIYENEQSIFSCPTMITEKRNVYRNKFLDIVGRGSMGCITFSSIILDLAEV